jgi:C4-dicarboxylate-specific signal transduction histidine kinase
MNANGWPQHLAEAEAMVRALQQELAETNRGLVALTMELESRVDERTADLCATQEELQRTNSELLQMTLELEDRVAQRTAAWREANERLQHELEERQRAEEALRRKDEELRTISQQLWQAAKLATMGELAASIAHELSRDGISVSIP